VSGADGMMKLLPSLIRIPDVAFVRRDPNGPKIPNEPVPAIAPTLAVEVLSESNTAREMQRKIGEYFAAGAELVWIIDPDACTADIYTSPTDPARIGLEGELRGEPALPGFVLRMKELFDELDRQFAK
jgi:Uma2 family endonuclease